MNEARNILWWLNRRTRRRNRDSEASVALSSECWWWCSWWRGWGRSLSGVCSPQSKCTSHEKPPTCLLQQMWLNDWVSTNATRDTITVQWGVHLLHPETWQPAEAYGGQASCEQRCEGPGELPALGQGGELGWVCRDRRPWDGGCRGTGQRQRG